MIPNNNLSVLPWYEEISEQNARKWWVYDRIYPLFVQQGFMIPFQIILPHTGEDPHYMTFNIHDGNTGAYISGFPLAEAEIKEFPALGYDVVVFPGLFPVTTLPIGRYFLAATIDDFSLWSEVFTVVQDIQPYLKITWWDADDFVMDAGAIVYKNPSFKNVLYLDADLAKPEYPFEEEGETRDGYFFPTKQISEKRYKFSFWASEYLLDVMRFIRMSDYAEIEYHGQRYSLDTFLITPEWENNGDIAGVQAEFDTATVAKKIGLGYIKSGRGDFNDDFNDDFNNE